MSEDRLKHRRRMAKTMMWFAIVWYWAVLLFDVFSQNWGAAVVTAYLGVPAALAGLNLWKYLKACEKDDARGDGAYD